MGEMTTTDGAPPEPSVERTRALARMKAATEWAGPGRYLISSRSAPTESERRALTLWADELRAGMAPAEAKEIGAEVLRMMAGYPSMRLNREEAARLAAAFVASLSKLPLWAIRKACLNWTTGAVAESNPAFPPNAVQIKLEADRVANTRQTELGAIDMVLKAEVVQLPTEADRQKATEYWDKEVRPLLQSSDVTEDLRARETQAFLMATRRLLEKEIASAQASESPAMTMDMRRKLGIPIKPARPPFVPDEAVVGEADDGGDDRG